MSPICSQNFRDRKVMAARCSGFIRDAVEIMESSCSVRSSFLSLFRHPHAADAVLSARSNITATASTVAGETYVPQAASILIVERLFRL
jgi:hypothetical protein